MKKTLLTLFGAFVISASALAATVNVASDGTVWLDKPQPVVSKVEVAFDEGVLDLGDSWKQAFAQKGTVVPVEAHFESRRDGLFYVERTRVVDVGVVYDGVRMSLVRGVVGEPEVSSTPYVILWLLSVILTAVGVRHATQGGKSTGYFTSAFLATFVASGSTVIVFGTFASTVFAAFTGFAILVASDEVKRKPFYIAVVTYYVLMAMSLAMFLFA